MYISKSRIMKDIQKDRAISNTRKIEKLNLLNNPSDEYFELINDAVLEYMKAIKCNKEIKAIKEYIEEEDLPVFRSNLKYQEIKKEESYESYCELKERALKLNSDAIYDIKKIYAYNNKEGIWVI